MNRLNNERRSQIVSALCDGNSIRGTARMTGAAVNTVAKLLRELGSTCLEFHDSIMHSLPCNRLQCDRIWSFAYSNAKSRLPEHEGEFGIGDVWTWTALDSGTKLVPCWHVGGRDSYDAWIFVNDLARRLSRRVRLTTDGQRSYLEAVESASFSKLDPAKLIKLYGPVEPTKEVSPRYSLPDGSEAMARVMPGASARTDFSTGRAERQNLTSRMSMRRIANPANAFSKKLKNHVCAMALYFTYYNFARTHRSLANPYNRTPAMAGGLTDHVWTVEEIVNLLG